MKKRDIGAMSRIIYILNTEYQCREDDENGIRTHVLCHSSAGVLTITLSRLPGAITISISTFLRGLLSEMTVQTIIAPLIRTHVKMAQLV